MTAKEREQADLEDTVNKLDMALKVSGGVSFVLFLMSLSVMGNIVSLVTPVKAFTILLQATSIAQMPLGIGLIAAGVYVADTAASVDAPFAAFGIFIMGVLVLVLTLIGLAGTSIHSRGIIKLYMISTALLSALFLVFGVVSLVQADTVQGYVSDNWDSVRRVLPSTFAGKYDKEQFEKFIASNLLALGFMALVVGLVLTAQWESARRLRVALKIEADIEGRDEMEEGLTEKPGAVQMLWKQRWTHGSKQSRRVIMCTCCCTAVCVSLILTMAVLSLYFSTSCASIGEYKASRTLTSDDGMDVFVDSSFTRGVVSVSVASSSTAPNATFTYEKGAFRKQYADTSFPALETDTTLGAEGIDADPKSPTQVLGFDVSCQFANVDVALPPAARYGGNSFAESERSPSVTLVSSSGLASVQADVRSVPEADRPRLRRLVSASSDGPTDLAGLLVGAEGLQVSTTLGDISLEDVDGACDPALLGEPDYGVDLSTQKGAIIVSSSAFRDCDVKLSAVQSLTEVVGSVVTNTNGGGTMYILGTKGLIDIRRSTADVFSVRGDEGSVVMSNVTGREAVKVATASGRVTLSRLAMAQRGVVQVETSSGDISVSLSRFAGIISIVTGGDLSCGGAGFDSSTPCEFTSSNGLKIVEEATANCASQNDCPYQGELVITSDSGRVSVNIDAWARS